MVDSSSRPLSLHPFALSSRSPAVSWLPPEILSITFHMLLQMHQVFGSKYSLQWIVVTHVCRYWRQLAFNCSTLWTYIDTTDTDCSVVSEFLRRSRSASLAVRVSTLHWDSAENRDHDSQSKPILDAAKLALSHMPRIRDLRIRLTDRASSNHLLPFFSLPASSLQSLAIYDYHQSLNFSESLFGPVLPVLRSLELYGTGPSWDSSILRGLSQLIISGSTLELYPSMPELLDILGSSPQLERLHLETISTSIIQDIPLPTHAVDLPQLQQLTLAFSHTQTCVYLLNHMVVPAAVLLSLSCANYPILEPIAVIPQTMLATMPSHSLKVEVACSNYIHTKAVHTHGAEVDVQIVYPQQASDFPLAVRAFRAVFGSMLPHVEVFEILPVYRDSVVTTALWETLLSALPNIRALTLRDRYSYALKAEVLVDALVGEEDGEREGLEKVPLLCPELTALEFEGVNFRSQQDLPGRLLTCLINRRDRGVPLEKLVFTQCTGIRPEVVFTLNALVDEVVWR